MALLESAERKSRSRHSHPLLAKLLFALDVYLRRRRAVFEFSENPCCVFRLEIARLPHPLALRDGTRVQPSERIVRLHLWNEHVPPLPPNGATIAWARQARQAMATSLHELARYLASRDDLNDIAVICADAASGTKTQREQIARIMGWYGFEAIGEPGRVPIRERLHRFGENILISLLVFAQNAAALRLDSLARTRLPVYLSRRCLQAKFGGAGGSASGAAEAS